MSNKSEHNRNMTYSAEHWAAEMTVDPSKLEERMMAVLDKYDIRYEFQKIFYILADDGWIDRFYIADFYIPDKKIIIEVDGKFHDKHKLHDKQRTKDIQRQYPDIEVLRYKWKDVADEDKMNRLIMRLVNE